MGSRHKSIGVFLTSATYLVVEHPAQLSTLLPSEVSDLAYEIGVRAASYSSSISLEMCSPVEHILDRQRAAQVAEQKKGRIDRACTGLRPNPATRSPPRLESHLARVVEETKQNVVEVGRLVCVCMAKRWSASAPQLALHQRSQPTFLRVWRSRNVDDEWSCSDVWKLPCEGCLSRFSVTTDTDERFVAKF